MALRTSIGAIAKCIGYKERVHVYIYVVHAAVALDCVNFRREKKKYVKHFIVFTRIEQIVL